MKLPAQIKIVIAAIVVLTLFSITKKLYENSTSFYNSVKKYQFEYSQLEQNQITTFDNNYLIFKDKSNIAELNKETFITVTQIIFENRADGMNVAWKWVHENQPVNYTEFTKFYSDLSTFTTERFKENNSIERRKQEIVKQQNQLIITFPGIIYNYFFKFTPMEYKEGFITEETRLLFNKPG